MNAFSAKGKSESNILKLENRDDAVESHRGCIFPSLALRALSGAIKLGQYPPGGLPHTQAARTPQSFLLPWKFAGDAGTPNL